MDMVEPTFGATTFTKNRERLLAHDAAGEFFRAVVEQARKAQLMSSEHFTVDGTLIDAWASLKSFKKLDGRASEPGNAAREDGHRELPGTRPLGRGANASSTHSHEPPRRRVRRQLERLWTGELRLGPESREVSACERPAPVRPRIVAM
jgi:hypothetical protein